MIEGFNLLRAEPISNSEASPLLDDIEAQPDIKKKEEKKEELSLTKIYYRCASYELELQSTDEDIRSLLVLAELFKKSMQSGEKKRASNIYG